ncbi:MAG TPA: MarR family transcriptional regulator [Candidatus Dormibacteraeota bacterium]|nr:MarR family transcriptional regulator [Candidatus Dormibacteraeota bacterium]
MKPFTSNKFDMKRFTESAAGLAIDEDGRLYSPEVRQLTDEHFPPTARPIVEALSALGVAARLLHLSMERWAEQYGLSEGRLAVLLRLQHHAEGISLGELAASLHVSPRNVTGLIDHLERDGLVVRVADPTDRRSVLARLTDRGRARLDGLWQEAIQFQSRCVRDISLEELAQLRHLCLRLVQNLKSR